MSKILWQVRLNGAAIGTRWEEVVKSEADVKEELIRQGYDPNIEIELGQIMEVEA
ncbi:MAG: hypothetical protein V1490_02120 [Candidatus Omnitrophota bacterium]